MGQVLVVVALLLGAAIPAQAADKTVSIVASEFQFEPSQVTLERGQEIVFELENHGALAHNLSIEAVGEKTRAIQPDETGRVAFTADRSGTFRIKCTVPGHAQAGMVGTITVK